MSENETPEAAEAIQALFTSLDELLVEHCPAIQDQIGLLLTAILIRVSWMASDPDIKPQVEINRICKAMKTEWRLYRQLEQATQH